MDTTAPVRIHEGIYWVGLSGRHDLNCNPYLIIDGEEAVLFDPGSVLDFETVLEKVTSLVPLENLKYVVLHHQDPDVSSSVPLFEQAGGNFTIVTHWRTEKLVRYYGIKSPYYIVNEHGFGLTLSSGRRLSFVNTPYLHFPGAIATYDRTSKVLFSSDLFGAFSSRWELFADDGYLGRMKAFHEHYMPSNDILRPVMEVLLQLDIDIIAPQHGSVITRDIPGHIRALRELQCGTFLRSVIKDITKAGGYAFLVSQVLRRSAEVFSPEDIVEAISPLDISFNPSTFEVTDYNYSGGDLWNKVFDAILGKLGVNGLTVLEPLVRKLSSQYDVSLPLVYETEVMRAEAELQLLNEQYKRLRTLNAELEAAAKETEERVMRCPVTGLYNYTFFRVYLEESVKRSQDAAGSTCSLMVISVDEVASLELSLGSGGVDEALKTVAHLVRESVEQVGQLFRLAGASFGVFLPDSQLDAAVELAEDIRNAIGGSDRFIQRVTLSIGVTSLDEVVESPEEAPTALANSLYELSVMRSRIAKQQGMNRVVATSSAAFTGVKARKVLLVDPDELHTKVIATLLSQKGYEVLSATDGEAALEIVEKESPDLLLCETMLPKVDGFAVRQQMVRDSQHTRVPVIFASYLKDETSVQRALDLGVVYYFQKPLLLAEVTGIIGHLLEGVGTP